MWENGSCRSKWSCGARIANHAATVSWLRERAIAERGTYQDTYYDWPDRRLERDGRRALRLRVIVSPAGTQCLWGFKGATPDAARTPEWETTVGDVDAARSILLGLGLEPVITYTKECESFRFAHGDHPVSATIVRVPEIDGTFIEVEVVVPDGADTAAAETVVRSVLDDLGLSDQDLEWSFYGDLVRQARKARPGS